MNYKDFEDYLQTKHAEQAHGVLDDDMPDDYERWLSDLSAEEFIEYADKYARIVRNQTIESSLMDRAETIGKIRASVSLLDDKTGTKLKETILNDLRLLMPLVTQKMKKSEFYENKERAISPEVDFGVFWMDGKRFPQYRVTWIEYTGEVYAIDLTPTQDESNRMIEILGVAKSRATIEEKLKGWSEVPMSDINSLSWVRERMSL